MKAFYCGDVLNSKLINTEVSELPELSEVEARWRLLEEQANCSFFISWAWIGTWLKTLPSLSNLKLFEAKLEDEVIGLAIIGRHASRRNFFVNSKGWYLNETGSRKYDEITIEQNDVLCNKEYRVEVRKAFIEECLSCKDWNELYLSGIHEDWVSENANNQKFSAAIMSEEMNCFNDLIALREEQGEFLQQLGKNTRYRIRKTKKWFEKNGEITIAIASSKEEALEFLERLKFFHQQRWQKIGKAGSFASEYFEKFHRQLIVDRFSTGEIQLVQVRAGQVEIGYLYNLVYKGCSYSYQCGFNYLDDRYQPGMLCYAEVINELLKTDLHTFDFLAGGQYKENLTKGRSSLLWIVVQRNNLVFKLENVLKRIKRRLFQ